MDTTCITIGASRVIHTAIRRADGRYTPRCNPFHGRQLGRRAKITLFAKGPTTCKCCIAIGEMVARAEEDKIAKGDHDRCTRCEHVLPLDELTTDDYGSPICVGEC